MCLIRPNYNWPAYFPDQIARPTYLTDSPVWHYNCNRLVSRCFQIYTPVKSSSTARRHKFSRTRARSQWWWIQAHLKRWIFYPWLSWHGLPCRWHQKPHVKSSFVEGNDSNRSYPCCSWQRTSFRACSIFGLVTWIWTDAQGLSWLHMWSGNSSCTFSPGKVWSPQVSCICHTWSQLHASPHFWCPRARIHWDLLHPYLFGPLESWN